MEIKIREFNYKVFCNILANGANLYKWKKRDTDKCIYCTKDTYTHDSEHLLFKCNHLGNIWTLIRNVLNKEISWKAVVFGINDSPSENMVISYICYIIYKKYLIDKDHDTATYLSAKGYIKKELQYILASYQYVQNSESMCQYLNAILHVF